MGSPTSAFVADPGEEFDPKAVADDEPTAPAAEPGPGQPMGLGFDMWEEPTVRGLLEAQGNLLHAVVAVDKDSDEWRHTKADLGAIAPPLTRILNRYDATRAAAATGDELALLIGLGGYVTRSYTTRRRSLAELRPQEPQPVTGRGAAGAPAASSAEGPADVEPGLSPAPDEGNQWTSP